MWTSRPPAAWCSCTRRPEHAASARPSATLLACLSPPFLASQRLPPASPLPFLLPPPDYLPSPLDVDNFALDLKKDEDRVLLPCSRCPAQLSVGRQRSRTGSMTMCLWPAQPPALDGACRMCGRSFKGAALKLPRFAMTSLRACRAVPRLQEGAAGGSGVQAGGGALRAAHLHAHLLRSASAPC